MNPWRTLTMKKQSAAKSPRKESLVDHETPPDLSHNGRWDLIAMKAYELYEQRGRLDGHDVEDWLTAEAIVTGTST
jgi:DUF2934 family protein